VVVPFLSIHMISRTVVPFSPTWLGLLVHVPFIDHVGKKNINQGKRANRFADVIVFSEANGSTASNSLAGVCDDQRHHHGVETPQF